MRNQYTALTSNDPKPLSKENQEMGDDFAWANFWGNLKEQPSAEIRTLMKKYILDLLLFQSANFEERPVRVRTNEQLFNTMNPQEIQDMATHLYVAIQLIQGNKDLYEKAVNNEEEYASSIYRYKPEGWEDPAFEKYPHPIPFALEQENPYLLRVHVYHLFHRMQTLMTGNDSDSEDSLARREVTLQEAERTLKKIPALAEKKFPALAHLLSAYAHATLAMGSTDQENSREQWKLVYTQILWTEKVENDQPSHMFLVNRGQDLYQSLPHESFAAFKNEVAELLGPDETERLSTALNRRLGNRN